MCVDGNLLYKKHYIEKNIHVYTVYMQGSQNWGEQENADLNLTQHLSALISSELSSSDKTRI